MDTELTAARLAHQSMLATARRNAPSAGSGSQAQYSGAMALGLPVDHIF